jgi:hypothetical protein
MGSAAVECTHCRVTMTSWSAPGSPIRYYQCPFCQRTHSSHYDEVFAHGAGARLVDAREHTATPGDLPMASPEAIAWAGVKIRAARWFARLEAEERRATSARATRGSPPAQTSPRVALATVAAVGCPARHR